MDDWATCCPWEISTGCEGFLAWIWQSLTAVFARLTRLCRMHRFFPPCGTSHVRRLFALRAFVRSHGTFGVGLGGFKMRRFHRIGFRAWKGVVDCRLALVAALLTFASASAADRMPVEMQEYAAAASPAIDGAPFGAPDDVDAGSVVCRSLCCPEWNSYALFDVLFLQRDNMTNDQAIAIANKNAPSPGQVLLTTRSMEPAVAPGIRLFYGRRTTECTGWEVGYYGIYGMFGNALTGGVDQLQIPGDLGQTVPGWATADLESATYFSTLNMAEVNVFRYDCCGSRDPCARLACKRCYHCNCIDWLAGFRWAGLEEQANLNITCCQGDPPSPYTANTSSNLFGAQLGVRGRTEWQRFAFEGWIKTALAGASLYQSQSSIVSSITHFEERPPRASWATGLGMIADINISGIYRINRVWGLRAGYNMIWLSGVALAPNQWDFTSTAQSGYGLNHGSGLFLNGANLGLEARW